MIAEFGVLCLSFAAIVASFQFCYFLLPGQKNAIAHCMPTATWLQALAISLALGSLMILRIESDFSVSNVVEHSNLTLPLLYKIVGTWGNHEGSMLLWLLIMAGFATALSLRLPEHKELIVPALAVQSGLTAATCGFVLFTSNPFIRVFPPAVDGRALNPLLQDIGLAIHPPLLYLGYVGFSLVFSLAVAALIVGKAGSVWAKLVHPWVLFSWSALTVGIGLGSWWAYRELGWGGWWFWDPVENASLLPWLAGLALLHSNIVLKKRNRLASWVILLAIITFALSLMGTFLVRSGALTSVHSFASDPSRGLYILGFIVISVGAALSLFALRGGRLQSKEVVAPVSREGAIVLNNVFVMAACATVLLGTMYPLLVDWAGGKPLTVGAPYFNATFLPLMALPVCFAALAPFMQWKNASLQKAFASLLPVLLAAFAAVIIVLAYAQKDMFIAAAGIGLCVWLGLGSVFLYLRKRSVVMLPVCIAHLGAAVLIAGITAEALWKHQAEHWIALGDSVSVAGYDITLHDLNVVRRNNHTARRAHFSVSKDAAEIASLYPEYRLYDIRNNSTSETAIHSSLAGDIYTVIGEVSQDEKKLSTRIYYVPFVYFIWLGFALMATGGILAITQTKKRS